LLSAPLPRTPPAHLEPPCILDSWPLPARLALAPQGPLLARTPSSPHSASPHSPHAARTVRHAHPLGVSPAGGVSPSSQLRWPARRRPCFNLAATPRVALTTSGAPSWAPNSAPPLVPWRPSRAAACPPSRVAAAPSSRASAVPPSGASAVPPSGASAAPPSAASAAPPSAASATPPSGEVVAPPSGPSSIPSARVAGLSNTPTRAEAESPSDIGTSPISVRHL